MSVSHWIDIHKECTLWAMYEWYHRTPKYPYVRNHIWTSNPSVLISTINLIDYVYFLPYFNLSFPVM